jgi:hypothetical protein
LIPVPLFLRGVRGDLKVPKVTAEHFSNNLLEILLVIKQLEHYLISQVAGYYANEIQQNIKNTSSSGLV